MSVLLRSFWALLLCLSGWSLAILSAANSATKEIPALVLTPQLGHSESVGSVAVTPDGRHVVSGGSGPYGTDTSLKLWDLATGKLIRTFEGHSERIGAVAVAPDGRRVVSGSFDGSLKLWNLATGELLRTFKGHSYIVHAVAITGDGRRIISGSYDNSLSVWDLATGKRLRTFKIPFYARIGRNKSVDLDSK